MIIPLLILGIVSSKQTKRPESLKALALKLEIDTINQSAINFEQNCVWLKEYQKSTPQDFYYTKLAASILEDCDIEVQFDLETQGEDFETFYYSSLYLGQCNNVTQFLTQGGAAKPNLKKNEDNYRTAAQLYHLASVCNDSSVYQSIQEAIYNFQEIYEGVTSILERENSATVTAQILYSFFSLSIPKEALNKQVEQLLSQKIYQQTILNLLYQRNKGNISIEEKYWITKLFELLNWFVYPQLADYYEFDGKQASIKVKYVNLKGEKVASPNVTVLLNDKQLTQSVLKSKEINYETDEIGTLPLLFQFSSYQLKYQVRVLEKIVIEDILFDIVESKTAKPNFQHNVEFQEFYPVQLQASERSFLHIIIKVPQLQQVAVRLVNQQYPSSSTQVFAEYDSKRKIYYAIIDFGDPDHISPINAIYKVELLVADQNIVPLRWQFLNIDAHFQAQSSYSDDSTYKLPQQIIHQFQKEQPDVPFWFVQTFVAVIVLSFLFYIRILKNLNLSFEAKPLLVYIFLALIIGVFLTLTLFWIKLNLIETITVLGTLSIPLIVVGNYALLSLRQKEKKE